MTEPDAVEKWTQPKPIMSVESLLDYGFKEWPISSHDRHDRHFQYCVRDDLGKKLFAQVRLWCFSKHTTAERRVEDSFDAWCQFDMRGAKTFNVDLSVNDMTPAQVVEWFVRMHDRMACTYYEPHCDNDGDGETETSRCGQCRRFLFPEEAAESPLCPDCGYEKDTGFKRITHPPRRRRR